MEPAWDWRSSVQHPKIQGLAQGTLSCRFEQEVVCNFQYTCEILGQEGESAVSLAPTPVSDLV